MTLGPRTRILARVRADSRYGAFETAASMGRGGRRQSLDAQHWRKVRSGTGGDSAGPDYADPFGWGGIQRG